MMTELETTMPLHRAMDLIEALAVQRENERRAYEHAKQQSGQG